MSIFRNYLKLPDIIGIGHFKLQGKPGDPNSGSTTNPSEEVSDRTVIFQNAFI